MFARLACWFRGHDITMTQWSSFPGETPVFVCRRCGARGSSPSLVRR